MSIEATEQRIIRTPFGFTQSALRFDLWSSIMSMRDRHLSDVEANKNLGFRISKDTAFHVYREPVDEDGVDGEGVVLEFITLLERKRDAA